jgi:hypothetical protein
MDFFVIVGIILLGISGIFGWIISEKWHILTEEEKKAYLYVTFGGFFLSCVCWLGFIMIWTSK